MSWNVARGRAPSNPQLAEAAIELAESYTRQGRVSKLLIGWVPALMVLCFGYIAIAGALEGDMTVLIPSGVIVVIASLNLLINPLAHPRNIDRSLEASKQLVAAEVPS